MKKKILSFIFAICFILPCAFIFSACGDNGDGGKKQFEVTARDSYKYYKVYNGYAAATPTKYDFTIVPYSQELELIAEWYQGETKLNAAPTMPGNYKLAIRITGNDEYEDYTTVKDFEIRKATGDITAPNPVSISKDYDGLPVTGLDLSVYTIISDGQLKTEYKLQSEADSCYTTTAPSNPGEYTMKVTIPETECYTAVEKFYDFSIRKVQPTLTVPTSVWDFTYNKQPIDLASRLSSNSSGEISVKYYKSIDSQTEIGAPVNVGSYVAEVNILETAQYAAYSERHFIDINPRPLTISYSGNKTKAYDGGFEFYHTFTTAEGLIAGDDVFAHFYQTYNGQYNYPIEIGTYNNCGLSLRGIYGEDKDNYSFGHNQTASISYNLTITGIDVTTYKNTLNGEIAADQEFFHMSVGYSGDKTRDFKVGDVQYYCLEPQTTYLGDVVRFTSVVDIQVEITYYDGTVLSVSNLENRAFSFTPEKTGKYLVKVTALVDVEDISFGCYET